MIRSGSYFLFCLLSTICNEKLAHISSVDHALVLKAATLPTVPLSFGVQDIHIFKLSALSILNKYLNPKYILAKSMFIPPQKNNEIILKHS